MKHIDILTEKSRISSNINIKKVFIYNAMLKFQFGLKKKEILSSSISHQIYLF